MQVECTRMHTWDFECTKDGNQSYIGSRRRKCVLVRIRVHSTCNIICANLTENAHSFVRRTVSFAEKKGRPLSTAPLQRGQRQRPAASVAATPPLRTPQCRATRGVERVYSGRRGLRSPHIVHRQAERAPVLFSRPVGKFTIT